jgi:hypothetical protein
MISKEYTLQNIDNNSNGITYKGYTATNGEWCIIADDGTNQRAAYGPKNYSAAWANRVGFMYTQEAPKNLFISNAGASTGLVTVFDSSLQKLVPAVTGVAVKTGKNTLDDGSGNADISGGIDFGNYATLSTGGLPILQRNGSDNGINIICLADICHFYNAAQSTVLMNLTSSGLTLNVGNFQLSGALNCNLITTLTGTTAGSVKWSQYMQGQFKAFAAQFLSYENNTTTSQTITFPTSFVNTPVVVTNTTGLTITVTTTTLTIGAPNNTTLYSGIVKVEGF